MRKFVTFLIGVCCLRGGEALSVSALHGQNSQNPNFQETISLFTGRAPAAPTVGANPPANTAFVNVQPNLQTKLAAIFDSIRSLRYSLDAQITQAIQGLETAINNTLTASHTTQQITAANATMAAATSETQPGTNAETSGAQFPKSAKVGATQREMNAPTARPARTNVVTAAEPGITATTDAKVVQSATNAVRAPVLRQDREDNGGSAVEEPEFIRNNIPADSTEQPRSFLDLGSLLLNLSNRTDTLTNRIEEFQKKFSETGLAGLAEELAKYLPGANSTSRPRTE